MKKFLVVISLFLLVGCSTKVEEEKYAYLEYKNDLEEQTEYDNEDSLDFNTYFNIKREEEIVNYSLVIDKPKVNMYNVKALLIHDFMNEDAFPSVGIFDDPVNLMQDSDDKIILKGTIQTTDDISNVKYKLYLEYTDEEDNENKFYYEVQRG